MQQPVSEQSSRGGNGDGAPAATAPLLVTGLDQGAREQLLGEPSFAADAPAFGERPLLAPTADPEPFWKRSLFLGVAIALAGAYLFFTQAFWAPAHWGNNQNGYLVGAKMLAQTGTRTGFEPKTPYSFVGWMWLMADETSTAPGGGMHYPKYPLGVPLLDAIVYRIGYSVGGEESAILWTYRVSPVCMSLALLGTFLITRALAGSFAGLIAMILLGSNPVVLLFTNNPNSHAASLCFLCLGAWMLVRWWQTGSVWRGLLAGLLLGYAVTIRYTEGLMLLPLAAAVLLMITYRGPREISWWRAALWSIAVTIAFVLASKYGFAERNPASKWPLAPSNVPWWQRILVILVPLLLTIRWRTIRESFHRESLLRGQWLRLLGCALLTLAILLAPLPKLGDKTPAFLHAMRFAGILAAMIGAIVLLHSIRWKQLGSWLPQVSPVIGWMIPVVALLAYNRITMGAWTGYDTTNESSGFTWNMFVSKWRFAVDQLYDTGLYALMPLGIAGLALTWRWNWRAALVLTLWFLPGTLLYMSYYYGMGMPMIGYLRFFASMLPPAIIAAAWLLQRASNPPSSQHGDGVLIRGSIAAPIAVGVFVALAAAANMHGTVGAMERDYVICQNLADVGRRVREAVPKDSVVLGNSQRLLNYLQFAGSFDLYGADYFRNGFPVPSMGSQDPGQPNPIQPARKRFLNKAYENRDNAEMVKAQNQIMLDALGAGRRVFVVQETGAMGAFRRTFLSSKQFQTSIHRKWLEPARMSSSAVKTLANLGGDGAGRSVPQNWQIVEVKLAPPPPPAPASAPATAPATAPAPATGPS